MYTPLPTYHPPKPEEDKSIARNYLNMFGDAMSNSVWNTCANLWGAWALHESYKGIINGDVYNSIALGIVCTGSVIANNFCANLFFSEYFQDERKHAAIKKSFLKAHKEKDSKTIETLLVQNGYLEKWSEKFITEK